MCQVSSNILRSSRDKRIDLLRFVALMGVILAHVGPSSFWLQARNFDVPLMVLLSGMSFSYSSGVKISYVNYSWKRFKRLVIPVWCFLTFYFICFPELDFKCILSSYFLISGIGYVWVIRVFLITSLLAPLLYTISSRIRSNATYIALIFFTSLLLELFLHVFRSQAENNLYIKTVFITLPYIWIFMLGIRIKHLKQFENYTILLSYGTILVAILIYYFMQSGQFFPTQYYKYPPRLYYISYALIVSFVLLLFSNRLVIWADNLGPISKVFYWTSQHSIWIYLWHILLVKLVSAFTCVWVRYFLCVIGSVVITYFQTLIIKYISNKIENVKVKNNIRLIFEG